MFSTSYFIIISRRSRRLFTNNSQTSSKKSPFSSSSQLNRLKGKSVSSQQWLQRQASDPYVEKAKRENYRCRSAFKLLEIDSRFKLLKPGQIVVECGAAPGSWTQVIVKKINSLGLNSPEEPIGKIVAIDKQLIYPINGAIILGNVDFTKEESQQKIINNLAGNKPNVILSDMAPSATGIKEMDDDNIIKLCYSVLRFAIQISELNASLLVKLWMCNEAKKLEESMATFYRNVKFMKPNASRTNSAEIFLLATNFKGLKKEETK